MHSDLEVLCGQLEAIVGREHVAAGAARTAAFAVDGMLPELVVQPGTEDELSRVVAACAKAGAAMIPWGGGTAMGMGNAPVRAQVVLGMERLDRVVEWDPANLVVSAEAGMRLGALQDLVARERLILPFDPPAAHRVTLGGLVAANQSGPARLRYGTVRDWLLGLRVVLPNGERVHFGGRVIKNVSGYDMNKLFIRSMGTLGFITEVTFKLLPVPAQRAALIGLFPDLGKAWDAARGVQASFLLPEALDLLNATAVDLLAPTLGLPAAPGTCALAAALAGSPETVEREARELTARFEAAGGTALSLPNGQAAPAWQSICNLLEGANPARILCKITVPIARTADMVAAATQAGQAGGMRATVTAHACTGVIWARFLPGMEGGLGAPVPRVLEGLRQEAQDAGGSLVLHDAPPPLKRQVEAWGAPGDGIDMMRRLKAEFDPRGLCNPGRFLGGI